jgi:7-cyano-7-deazaguanine reductase
MTHYVSADDVAETIEGDLSDCAGADVDVLLHKEPSSASQELAELPGVCLDTLRVRCHASDVDPALLRSEPADIVREDLHTHLLRSLCPVTQQPDTGSVLVSYRGPRIDREGLLRYVVSFRQHEGFHESCVERIFVDILNRCNPEKLSVYARYQRRGGIDINPFRSNFQTDAPNIRLWRQ